MSAYKQIHQEDRGSVWVEMEYYKSITPARKNSKRSLGQSSFSYRVAWAELHRTTSSWEEQMQGAIWYQLMSWCSKDVDDEIGLFQLGRRLQSCPTNSVRLQVDTILIRAMYGVWILCKTNSQTRNFLLSSIYRINSDGPCVYISTVNSPSPTDNMGYKEVTCVCVTYYLIRQVLSFLVLSPAEKGQ